MKQLIRSACFLGAACASAWAQTRPVPIEPRAGAWKTWVIESGAQFRPAPPPDRASTASEIQWLRDFMSGSTAATRVEIDFWDVGAPASRWADLVSERVRDGRTTVIDYARLAALVSVAVQDATIAAWDAKYLYNRPRPSEFDATLVPAVAVPRSPSYPSEHAAASAAAAEVLAFIYPAEAEYFRNLAEESGRSRLAAGVQFPSDVVAGRDLGRAVGARVVEYARNDGTQTPWTGTVPTGPGLWVGVNPVFANAQSWKPWYLSRPDEFRPPPPPAFGSARTLADLEEIKTFPRDFTSNARAFFWQTPEGVSSWFMEEISRKQFEYRLDVNPPRAARAYALVSTVWFDSLLASHDAKMTYFRARPSMMDPAVVTLFANPNHPSYPANHAMTATRAEMLAYLFPRHAVLYRQLGEEAGLSRIWAGIHFRSDIEASIVLGRQVFRKALERAQGDGSAAEAGVAP